MCAVVAEEVIERAVKEFELSPARAARLIAEEA
jgi:hypothetical protein